jgi:hypothetical protein
MLEDERSISEKIESHFQFLFDRGFSFRFVEYYPEDMGNWIVILESVDCLVDFTQDRGYIFISFGHNHSGAHDLHALLYDFKWFDLMALVYYLSKGKNYIGHYEEELRDKDKQLERLSRITAEYIDKIIPVMGKDFEKHRSNLLAVNKQVLEIQLHDIKTRGAGKKDS